MLCISNYERECGMNKSVLVAIIFFAFIGFVLFADVLISEPFTTEVPACLPNCANQTLNGSKLSGVDLRGVDFSGSDLHFSDLNRADLRGANLESADFYRADLNAADLRGANVKDVNIRGARMDGIQMPDGWDQLVKPFY